MSQKDKTFRYHLVAATRGAIDTSLAEIEAALFERFGSAPAMRDERGWLIEWPTTADSHPRWWHPDHGWTVDASRAIRYARKEDAEAAIRNGCFVSTICATEHAWLAPQEPADVG